MVSNLFVNIWKLLLSFFNRIPLKYMTAKTTPVGLSIKAIPSTSLEFKDKLNNGRLIVWSNDEQFHPWPKEFHFRLVVPVVAATDP